MKKIISVFVLVCMLCLCFASCDIGKKARYNEAIGHLEKRDYLAAYEIFCELGDYKDSQDILARFEYIPVRRQMSYGDIETITNITLDENNLPVRFWCSANCDTEDLRCVANGLTYDERGNLKQKTYVYNDGSIRVYDYTYDEENRLIKETLTFSSGAVHMTDYTYDEQGRLIKEVVSYDSGSGRIYEYSYDISGRLLQKSESSAHSDGFTYKTKYHYSYDADGNLVKELQTFENDEKTTGFDYVYDVSGNLLKRVHTLYSGVKDVYECTYDEKSNLIKEVYTDSDGETEIYDYVYDEEGNKIECGYATDSSERYVYLKAYYENGKLVKKIYTDADYDYIYDEHGNVIKKSCKSKLDREQTIEYEYKFVYLKTALPKDVREMIDDLLDYWSINEIWCKG